MKMCEKAGWVWQSGNQPNYNDYWRDKKSSTTVRVKNYFTSGDIDIEQRDGYEVLSLQEVKNKFKIKTMSNITTKLKELLIKEPNKTLYKAGLMDIDGNWSQEVKDLALEELLVKHMSSKEFIDKMLEVAKTEE